MNFETADLLEQQDCPICRELKYKNVIDQLLISGVSYESIYKYMYEKQGARIPASDIKYHKENHFKIREQRAFKDLEKQEETRQIFEKFREGQQRSIDLINTLNMMIEQCIARLQPLMLDNKGLVSDKIIISYMEQIRKTSESLAKLKGDLTEGTNINLHVVKSETEKLSQIVASVLDELAPELKDKFYLRLAEKLEEAEFE